MNSSSKLVSILSVSTPSQPWSKDTQESVVVIKGKLYRVAEKKSDEVIPTHYYKVLSRADNQVLYAECLFLEKGKGTTKDAVQFGAMFRDSPEVSSKFLYPTLLHTGSYLTKGSPYEFYELTLI